MRFIKTISGEFFDQFINVIGLFFGQPLADTALDKAFLSGIDNGLFLLADRLNQPIRLPQRNIPQPVTNPHHLFLVDHNTEGLFQHLTHDRMRHLPLGPVFSLDKVRDQRHRSRSIQRIGRDQILQSVRPQFHQQILHPAGFKLEHTLGPSGSEHLFEHPLIGNINALKINLFIVQHLDQIDRPPQHTQRFQPQKVHLQQTHFFNRRPFKLRDQLIVGLFDLAKRQKVR